MKRAPQTEREIQDAIRIRLSKRDDCVVWRNTTGLAVHGERKQRFGLAVGSSDLIGVVRLPSGSQFEPGVGVFLALEVKRPASPGKPAGALTSEQAMFLALVQRMGGIAIVATSADEANAYLDEAIARAVRCGR